MKKIILLSAALLILTSLAINSAQAKNCEHSWQTADDGSNCGGRAADQRSGGKP